MGRRSKKSKGSKFSWRKTFCDGVDTTYTCFYKGYPLGSVWTCNESYSGWPESPGPWFSGLEGEDDRLPDYSWVLEDAKLQVISSLKSLKEVPPPEFRGSGLLDLVSGPFYVDPFTGRVFEK